MKVLVAIASYGTRNDLYLAKLVQEYRSMPFDVTLIVLSNLQKEVAPEVTVRVVDLHGEDPWALPFLHKQIFAERIEEYDLFIYSEDDTLIREYNIRAFLSAAEAVRPDEIPGFLRFESSPEGVVTYPEIHGHFHWDPKSVRTRCGLTYASFTNDHAACYVLTRRHLKAVIESGGYLVPPHRGKYDLLCTAATDPYTQCGLTKLICISNIENFLVHHLPNKYSGTRFGITDAELRPQLHALARMSNGCHHMKSLLSTETRVPDRSYSKDYYEPPRREILVNIPDGVRTVLSLGCGAGNTEAWLASRGVDVTAIPLDPVIGATAAAKGVRMVFGDFNEAKRLLKGMRFDCLLVLNILHLVPDPPELLELFQDVLGPGSVAIVMVPNVNAPLDIWREFRNRQFRRPHGYEESGVQSTSRSVLKRWLRRGGLIPQKTEYLLSERARNVGRVVLGVGNQILASDVVAVAKRG